MRGNLILRAFLPLAVYGVFTELALRGLAGIFMAVSGLWPGAESLELSAAVPWANAAAGLAAVGLLWKWYGCGGKAVDEDSGPGLNLQREKNGSFFLLIILGFCCCLGGSGLISLLGEGLSGAVSSGSSSVEAISAGAKAAAAPGTAFSGILTVQPEAVWIFENLTLLLCSGFIIPFTEEFLFRRAMYGSLREIRSLGRAGALILSSVVFGLYHGQLLQGLYAGLLGAVLACLYQSRGKLAAPVTVHISANLSAIFLEMARYGEWLEGSRSILLVQTGAAVLSAALILHCLCKTGGYQYE